MKRVYFIRPKGMRGPVKIGCSQSPEKRRTSLATWSPFALEVVAEIEGGFDIERRFHRLFAGTHQRREWFEWSPEMQTAIDSINAGTFNLDTLPPPGKTIWVRGNCGPRTEEQKTRFRYQMRSHRVFRDTGFGCPVSIHAEPLDIAALDQFFAEPHVHGKAIPAPWAVTRQREWLAKVSS